MWILLSGSSVSAGTNQRGVQWPGLQSHLAGGAADRGHEGVWLFIF